MPELAQNAFTFISHGLAENTFSVVKFTGQEALSSLYSFDVLLVSELNDLDIEPILANPATLTIKSRAQGFADQPFHGILTSFEQLHQVGPYVFYRAELRPKMWWLTITRKNQIFLNMPADEFVAAVLKDGGLIAEVDFAIRLTQQFPPYDYACQYGESHFDFASRWAEHGGAYYWFEQGTIAERIICSDSLIAHVPLPGYETLSFSPSAGLHAHGNHGISSFTLKQRPLPQKVMLHDYNYMRPSLNMEAQAGIDDDQGFGEIHLWADRFRYLAGGQYLAKARAEMFKCMEKVFHGTSSIPGIRPGYLFTLTGHYRQDFNRQYLTTSVRHEGSQERWLVSGLGLDQLEDKDALYYRNVFECIPSTIQYRPLVRMKKPVVPGNLVAKIDAAGSGQYAEIDEHGRYKVIMPFDLSGRDGGKASCWLRMMTPYAGEGHGLHFPLLKGAEVMIGFEQGDIDRPFIAGAVFNPEKPNVVTDKNAAINIIRTPGGNEIVMGDERGKEFISLYSPSSDSSISLGSAPSGDPDDEPSYVQHTTGQSVFYGVGDAFSVFAGTNTSISGSYSNSISIGSSNSLTVGVNFSAGYGTGVSYNHGDMISLGNGSSEDFSKEKTITGLESVEISGGYSQALTAPLKQAYGALVLGLFGSASSAAGSVLTTDAFTKPYTKRMISDKKTGAALGITLSSVGVGLTIGTAVWIAKILKDWKAKTGPQAQGRITLNVDGVKIQSPKEVVIQVLNQVGQEVSSITVHGQGISLQGPEFHEQINNRIADIEQETRHIGTLSQAVENFKHIGENQRVQLQHSEEIIDELTQQCNTLKATARQGIKIDGKTIHLA
ncbi:type VI secretion system Vgr family protein [Thiorhodovibrio winogradskyi]|uniref:Type VI secretion system Vgr family protein n=1 Tax=Thiorhodovibrio winogradskyi TaxID=77007 RepID=A0ABZ0S9G4_9GAMM|nr:type VI secretion system tip protein TssI/VgrG [Thiorhodovibrio winogradskyi]